MRVLELARGGGEAGIRTLGRLSPATVFKTVPLDHSGTSPFDFSNFIFTYFFKKGKFYPLAINKNTLKGVLNCGTDGTRTRDLCRDRAAL